MCYKRITKKNRGETIIYWRTIPVSMIFGSINDLGDEAKYLPTIIQEALAHLKKTDLISLEKKKHPVRGDDLFLIIDEYTSIPASERVAEQHRKYIDIHYVIRGKELIGWGVSDKRNVFTEQYVPEKDRALFSVVANESFFLLEPGSYAIMFPSDIHRPGCCEPGQAKDVKKAVIKIAVDAL